MRPEQKREATYEDLLALPENLLLRRPEQQTTQLPHLCGVFGRGVFARGFREHVM